MDENTYVVEVNDTLETFISTDVNQATLGDQDWIGLAVETGLDDITKVKYNGTALTAQDVADANSVGLPKGSFILWVPYTNLPKEFTLSFENESKTITIEAM